MSTTGENPIRITPEQLQRMGLGRHRPERVGTRVITEQERAAAWLAPSDVPFVVKGSFPVPQVEPVPELVVAVEAAPEARRRGVLGSLARSLFNGSRRHR